MSNSGLKRWTVLCGVCLTAVIGSLFISGASAAPQTTEPTALTQVPVKVTDAGVTIARDKYTRGSTARYPRGAIVDFVITNRGTHFYKARLALTGNYKFSKYEQQVKTVTSDVAAKPGGKIHLKINFYFRSKFALQSLLAGSGKKHGVGAPIVIF